MSFALADIPRQVADALKIGEAEARDRIAGITQRLWGDLSAEDLATAGRVLAIINERASAELAR